MSVTGCLFWLWSKNFLRLYNCALRAIVLLLLRNASSFMLGIGDSLPFCESIIVPLSGQLAGLSSVTQLDLAFCFCNYSESFSRVRSRAHGLQYI